MAEKKDFYELLGVARDADQKTIKRAFLKLARKLHPDVSDDPHAEEKFKEVNEAYSVLSDEQKRANYDRYGDPNGPSGFGGGYVDMSDIFGGGFGGFGDIFDSFFGGGHGGRGAAQRTRGSDMGIRLSITLEEAAAGVTKTVAYTRLSTCDDCNGTGLGEGGKIEDCPRCHGTGTVVQVQNTVFGQMQSQTVCPECQGTGKKVEHACETCGGQGRTPDHERVSVEIPAGVHSGQSISITGKGEAGVRGDTSGDLIVTIEVSQHKDFERRGDDLFTSVSVDSLEAIVGTTVTIDGIIKDETIEISIPAGCKYGQQLSVAGKGMPRLHTKARGNLYVLVHIETSTGLTKDQLDTLTSLIDERKQNSAQETQDEQHDQHSAAVDSSDHKDKKAKKASQEEALMAHGIALINLGCRVNRVELDLMADSLLRMGCRIVEEDEAQAIVINTCAVTAEAEAKTRKAVRKAALMPGAPLVVATGCVASLFADELASLAPNVVVEAEKDKVADRVLEELGFAPESVSDDGLVISKPTPTGRTRPGIKIQDGCDNRCTFCIVWKARGAGKSLDPREVVSQVKDAMSRGAQEVVLTGINLGSYKAQLEAEGGRILRLPDLLEYVLEKTEVGRLRLSSLEPPDVNARLVEVIAASNGRIAPFLHICLQSGCDATLARMGRVYRTELYRKAVEEARSVLPTIALGTDLIVGFPGETDKEFDESYEFCRQMGFSKMHVFRYSKRPGTPAATAPNQVDPKVMAERAKKMRDLGNVMRFDAAKKLVGTCDNVVVQYPGRGISGGLFDVQVDPTIELDELIAMRFDEVLPNGTLKATRL